MKIKERKNKIQEYLLYLLIFLLPLQTRWMFKLGELQDGYYEYNTMSLYGVDIMLLLVLLVFIVRRFFQRELRITNYELPARNDTHSVAGGRFTNIWWLIGGLELFIFISIFSAQGGPALGWFVSNKWLALYGYGRFLLGIGLLFLITQINYDKIKLYWVIVLSGLAQSLLALYQFTSQQVYGSKWFGIATQYSSDFGVSVVDNGFRRWLRVYGGLPHPNILGGFLAVVLLVNVILYFELHKKFIATVSRNRIGLIFSLVFFIINFVGLLLTFSRSAWLGFFTGFVILSFHYFIIKRSQETRTNILKFVFVIVVISGCFIWGLHEPLSTRFNLDNRLESKSVSERINYNNDAWKIIKSNLLFGVGIKNYGLAVHDEINSERSVYEYEPVHNVFLLVWAEIGIIGLSIVILLYCYIVKLLKRDFEMLSLVIAMVVMMTFDHWWWSMGFGVYLFWLIIGLSLNKNINNSKL